MRRRVGLSNTMHFSMMPKHTSATASASMMGNAINFKALHLCRACAPVFTSLPQSDFATEKNASHFALVFALVCTDGHVISASLVASLVACIIGLALVCFAFTSRWLDTAALLKLCLRRILLTITEL